MQILLLLVYSDDTSQFVNPLFEAVHAHHGKDIGKAIGNDGNADDGRQYACSDIQVLEAKVAMTFLVIVVFKVTCQSSGLP